MRRPLSVGIAGFGTIGREVAQVLDGGIEGLQLCGVFTRSAEAAGRILAGHRHPAPLMTMTALADLADIVVECVPKAAFLQVAPLVVERGKMLVTVSGAALLDNLHLVDVARQMGGRIILASGALLGLDAVRAAAEGVIHSASIVTRKPPRSLLDAPTIQQQGIDLAALRSPLQVFSGSAREGARLFPANVNVAAALGLAGIGPDRTHLEIWADPECTRNTHQISVDADSATIEMKIAGVPSAENPSTGKITALSVIACIRSLTGTLRVGS
jgi:aspartate dehydrogenase